MGFFNFMMASSLMIWLIPLILEKKPSLSQRWWLMAGSTLLAGLHLYVFATAGMLMVCRLLASIRSTENPFRASINSLIPFLPGSVFLLVMLGLSDAGGRELALSAIGTKLWLFFSGSVFKGLDPGKEDRFVFWILLAVLVHLAYWIRSKSRTSEKWKSNPFLWVTTGSLILLLVIPDHVGAGSFLPYRVVFFLFLFLFLWLASHKVSVVHSFLVMIFLSIGNMGFLGYYAQFLPSHGKMAKELIACGEDMQEGSVVLSLSADAHWMQEHFSAYLGLTKELILLDNYELSSGAFPLKLDEANLYMVGQQPAHSISCHTITFPPSGEEKQVGYVLLLASRKESDVCKNAIKDLMSNGYSLLEEKPGFMLYQKKAALSDGLEGVQDK